MKKIMFAAYTLDIGGIETALVNLLNELSKKYDTTLVLEKKQGIFLEELNPKIRIIEYKPNQSKIAILRKMINSMKRIKFILKYKNKYNFAASFATYSKMGSFCARTASKNNALWGHADYLKLYGGNKKEMKDFFEFVRFSKFKKIIFVSKEAENSFLEVFPDMTIKTLVCNNLINAEKIIEKLEQKIEYEKENIFTFLNVGRHYEHQKKLTRLIEASEKLKKDNYKFKVLMVGDGQDFDMYKKLITEKHLEDTIKMLGRKQNPYPYFKISDCVILTSDYEGYPVVFNEAKVLGKPIITTNVSNADTEINGKYGIVVNKNAEDIYLAMKKMLDNKSIEYKHFDYNLYNDHIMETLEKLIENDLK